MFNVDPRFRHKKLIYKFSKNWNELFFDNFSYMTEVVRLWLHKQFCEEHEVALSWSQLTKNIIV